MQCIVTKWNRKLAKLNVDLKIQRNVNIFKYTEIKHLQNKGKVVNVLKFLSTEFIRDNNNAQNIM